MHRKRRFFSTFGSPIQQGRYTAGARSGPYAGITLVQKRKRGNGTFYQDGSVRLDRRRSGKVDFNARFHSVEQVPVKLQKGVVKLQIIADAPVLAVYVN